MKPENDHKFIVRADYFGDILTNQKKSFWLPLNRGFLYFSDDRIHYRVFACEADFLEVEFEKIIKIRRLTLNPRKNKWCSQLLSSPYYFLFWNPFWNRHLINITFLDQLAQPREVFFKLKTKKITEETLNILKQMLSQSIFVESL